jgi:hypothetical protein
VTSLNTATLTGTSSGLTTATTAYTDGDQLGAIISFNLGAAGVLNVSGILVDKANIVGGVTAVIFDRSVTLAADNAAYAISDADALFEIGRIELPGVPTGGNNRSPGVDSIAQILVPNASNTVYVALITRSGHTFFGAATDLVLRLSYSKDA